MLSGADRFLVWEWSRKAVSAIMLGSWLATAGPVIALAETASPSCVPEAGLDWRRGPGGALKKPLELRHNGE